jgi:hypothetical protein
MGQTIWVDIEGREKGELPDDNSIMLRLAEQLDKLADKLHVTKLTQFHDYSALSAEYADLSEEEIPHGKDNDPHGKAADGAWFDPQGALISVRTLCDHLTQHPEDLGFVPDAGQRHWPATLIQELKRCQAVLQDAAAHGRLFRFLIVS